MQFCFKQVNFELRFQKAYLDLCNLAKKLYKSFTLDFSFMGANFRFSSMYNPGECRGAGASGASSVVHGGVKSKLEKKVVG